MSTQLRLVEPPATLPAKRRSRAATRAPKATSAAKRSTVTPVARGGRRAAHWGDWHLDARTRRVGRAGVANARRALEAAAEELSQAS